VACGRSRRFRRSGDHDGHIVEISRESWVFTNGRWRLQRAELAKGIGIVKVAKQVGLGVGTVAKLKDQMVANS
jgi:hypothetical protein